MDISKVSSPGYDSYSEKVDRYYTTPTDIPSNIQDVFVLIKPEACTRGLLGKIITAFENASFVIMLIETRVADRDTLRKFVDTNLPLSKREECYEYLLEQDVACCVFRRQDAINQASIIIGDLYSPGSIRGKYGDVSNRGLIYQSTSMKNTIENMVLWTDYELDVANDPKSVVVDINNQEEHKNPEEHLSAAKMGTLFNIFNLYQHI